MFRSFVLVAMVLGAGLVSQAADWPQWRGPNRDGKSAETGLLAVWPAGGPKLVWKAQGLGEGYSSFSVVGNRLYTQGQKGEEAFVIAFDVATGKEVWKTPSSKPYSNDRGSGPRGTPTIDGDRLYSISGNGTLMCLNTKDGKKIWSVNFVETFGGKVPTWGYAESPLIDGDNVIVNTGGPEASVAALNKKTGKPVWKSLSDRAGYSSAIAFDVNGTHVIAALTGGAAVGLNAKNGEMLWRYDKVSNRTANIATPIVAKGYLFVSSDYGTGCALLKLTAEGGAVNATEVYFNKDMRNHYTSSVLVGDVLYGFSSAILTAMDLMTGEVKWKDRSVGKGNCIFADGKLYCQGEGGVIGLIDPNPKEYKEVSRFQIEKGAYPTWTPPVIANGKLYLREQDNLYCYDIKGN